MAFFTLVDRPSRNNSLWAPFSSSHGSILEPLDGFSSAFGQSFGRGGTTVDWIETPEAHVFKADLPGLTKEEIKVEVLDGRTLSISGKRNREVIQEKDNWRCVERSHGKFRRQFGLPEDAKVDEVVAKAENGVLTVTVPKAKRPAIPQVRAVSIA